MSDAASSLFGRAGSQGRRVREELIADTLAFAAEHSPYYQTHLTPHLGRFRGLEDLPLFPTTSKSVLAEFGRDLLTSNQFPAQLGLTSGTTYLPGNLRPPAVYYRSAEELRLAERLRDDLLDPEDPATPRDLALQLIGSAHGATTSYKPGLLLVPFERPFHLACIIDLLRAEFSFAGFRPRITTLISSLNRIKHLAHVIDHHAPSFWQDSALDTVMVYGSHLTKRWRAQLQSCFRSRLVNVYGLSEVPFSSTPECACCGGFHMSPVLVAEVISLRDGTPVTRGIGELVLTTLRPFISLQPLIRYRTGDIVRIVDCPQRGEPAVQCLGRLATSVISGDPQTVMPASVVHEVLDDQPDVHRELFPSLATFGVSAWLGAPRYRLRPPPSRSEPLTIDVEANFEPRHFPQRAQQLATSIADEIESRLNELGLPAPPLAVDILTKDRLSGIAEIFKP